MVAYRNPTVTQLAQQRTLGFGAAPIGNLYTQIDDDVASEAVETAYERGIRYFDTAPHYGLGLSEQRLGEVLRSKPRSEFLVSTKVGRLIRPASAPRQWDDEGFAVPGDFERVRDYSAEGVRRSLSESLERLHLDRVDVVYIHDPDDYWSEAMEGAVPELNRLKAEGVIGAWGVGMNQHELLERFVRDSEVDLIMVAGRYTLLDQSAAETLIPECAKRGVGVVNVGVFNSGILASARPQAGASYNYSSAPESIVNRATALAELALRHGTTLPAAAVHFSLRDSTVVNVTLGMATASQVTEDVSLLEAEVPEAFWTEALHRGLLAVDPRTNAH